jgi:hypothetical protein
MYGQKNIKISVHVSFNAFYRHNRYYELKACHVLKGYQVMAYFIHDAPLIRDVFIISQMCI